MPDTTRRLTPKRLAEDLKALRGLGTVEHYAPKRDEATYEALQQRYQTMIACQQDETEIELHLKTARGRARRAEWAFHEAVLAMKQSVLGQFGPDSQEIQAVGYKKKSDRKRYRRRQPPQDSGETATASVPLEFPLD